MRHWVHVFVERDLAIWRYRRRREKVDVGTSTLHDLWAELAEIGISGLRVSGR